MIQGKMANDIKITLSVMTSPYNAGVIAALIEIVETEGILFADPIMVSDFVVTLIDGLSRTTDDGHHYLIGRLAEDTRESWKCVADLLDICSNNIKEIIAPIA